jgi:hypothetical protein
MVFPKRSLNAFRINAFSHYFSYIATPLIKKEGDAANRSARLTKLSAPFYPAFILRIAKG